MRRTVALFSGVVLSATLLGCGNPPPKKETTTPAKEAAKDPAAKPGPATPAPGPAPAPAPVKVGSGEDPLPAVPRRPASRELVSMTTSASELVRGGQYEAGISAAKQVLRRDERYVPAMVVMARGYYHLKKNELAGSICDIAKKIDPTYHETYFLIGLLALRQDNKPSALASFRKAVELKDDFAAAWNNLGAQYLAAKNYNEAVKAFTKATQYAPRMASAHLNRGSALRGNQEPKRAEAEYMEAARLQPNYAEAYFNLGILYLDTQNFPGMSTNQRLDMAIQNFQRYKGMAGPRAPRPNPVDAYIEEARKAIERENKAKTRAAAASREKPKGPAKDAKATGKDAKPAGKDAAKPAKTK